MNTDTLLAIAHFAALFHSGQSSRGYRLLSMASRSLRRRGIDRPLDTPMSVKVEKIFLSLIDTYSQKV